MKLVDANVLLFAANEDSVQHRIAHAWLRDALSGGDTVGLPWTSLLAFIRISTNPRVMPSPLSASEASTLVDSWLSSPTCLVVEPGPRHLGLLTALLIKAGTAGKVGG